MFIIREPPQFHRARSRPRARSKVAVEVAWDREKSQIGIRVSVFKYRPGSVELGTEGDRVSVCLLIPHQTFKASQVSERQAHRLPRAVAGEVGGDDGEEEERGERAGITESRGERFYRRMLNIPALPLARWILDCCARPCCFDL